ncbi:AAA family ATPase [Aquibacillus sediminis]|uniref:AAA family ATPase n=1 Tax=Aquibacillus sediminis TaxID=2574734 RepID=UPI0011080DAD|nr:AAA family ATPase [Aquibacillus sediminis]
MAEPSNIEIPSPGKVIAICSAKGGIGKTLHTVNLAVALAKKNLNIAILDGDFQFGDVSLAMDVQPSFTIKDVIEEIDRLDSQDIKHYLASHSSGVSILPAPEKPEYAELVTSENLQKILTLLQQQHDYVVVDNGVGIQEQTVDIIEKADQILVLTNLEMTALKNTRMMLETLEKLGLRDKVRLIINRYNMESLIKSEDVASMFEIENEFYVPNNFKVASQSINLGIPIVTSHAKSDIAKAMFKIASSLTSDPIQPKPVDIDNQSKLGSRKKGKQRRKKWFSFKRKKGGDGK